MKTKPKSTTVDLETHEPTMEQLYTIIKLCCQVVEGLSLRIEQLERTVQHLALQSPGQVEIEMHRTIPPRERR